MAKFLLSTSDPRPCMVKYYDDTSKVHIRETEVKALFHMFNLKGDAIVEYENGNVETAPATSIRFLDSLNRFEQYCWGEEKEQRLCKDCKHHDTDEYYPCNICNSTDDHWEPAEEVRTCTTCKWNNTAAYATNTPCFKCSNENDQWEPKEEDKPKPKPTITKACWNCMYGPWSRFEDPCKCCENHSNFVPKEVK